jgi:hypothetical protein
MTEYFVVLTVCQPGVNQATYLTVTATPEVGPAATRAEIYQWVRSQLPDHLKSANTLFFTAEPNQVADSRTVRGDMVGGAVS